jgi:allophanate hydrolase
MSLPVFPKLSLAALRAGYAAGRTVDDVLEEVWDRIAERGDDGVWIWQPDWDDLRALAHSICRDPATQPLYGVPFAVKDNIDVAGWPTTAGCPEFAYVAKSDATVVARLTAAGAIPIGKTNLDQFATGLVGTRSPYGIPTSVFSDRHISGGSSSGSAVAVAAGEVAFSLGTDTAGSGRVPAACNGLVGLKPTPGLVSTTGVVPACRSLDCVSIFAHTADEAATVLDLIQGVDPADDYSRTVRAHPMPIDRPRVGVPAGAHREFFGDAAAAAAYEAFLTRVAALGWEVRAIDFTPFAEMARQLYAGPWVAERLAAVGEFLAAHPEAGHPVVRGIIEGAASRSAVDAYRGQYERARLKRLADATWSSVDCLLLPTIPTHPTVDEVLADPVGVNSKLGTYTNFVNLFDQCALAVPVGARSDDLPSSVTLVAPGGADSGLAVLGRTLMAACGSEPCAPSDATPPVRVPTGLVPLAVVGAHLRGQPLHGQLTERHAAFLALTQTAPGYRLYALANTAPPKPGLVRDPAFTGPGIEVEVYALTPEAFGSFTALVPPPLAIGNVELADGSWVKGFVCEPAALDGAQEVTAHGGWRKFLNWSAAERP